MDTTEMTGQASIWAIAGGKGGTGKSIVTAGLAARITEQNKRVVLADADFGGPNLHTIMGLKRPKRSISDFFSEGVPLEDLLVETNQSGLMLLPGDYRTMDASTITITQREKFFRHLKALPADIILVDLGAGSSIHTVDTFLMADRPILVTTPEVTSLDNLYLFVKKVLFRHLNMVLSQAGLKEQAKKAWRDRPRIDGPVAIPLLVETFQSLSPIAPAIINAALRQFRLALIVNQIRDPGQIEVGFSIRSVLQQYFLLRAAFVGIVRHLPDFWQNQTAEGCRSLFAMGQLADDLDLILTHLSKGDQIKR
jgi:flagellar biosynthesis protein FlhG